MADYSAKIQLIVEGLQALNKVEQKLKELNKLVQNDLRVDVKANTGIKKIGEDLDAVAAKGRAAAKSITDSFKNLGGIAKGGVIAGAIVGINQFGAALEAASAKAGLLGPTLDVIGSAVKGVTPGVDALVNAFTALPPALQATAPAIAAVTAGLLAFNQPIRTAIADTKTLVDTLTPVKNAIKNAFSTTLLMAFGEQIDININAVNNYRGALLSLTDTVSALSRRKSNLQAVLNSNNASTETAAKIAAKLVDVTKRLNAEQQAQNDLLRQAAGLRTESEERKATNKYNVTQRLKEYETKQKEEQIVLQQALLRLEERSAEVANKKLQTQGQINATLAQEVNTLRSGIRPQTQYAGEIGPGAASPVVLSSQLRGRPEQILAQRRDENLLQEALFKLEQRTNTELNKQLETRGQINATLAKEVNLLRQGIRPGTQYAKPIGPSAPNATNLNLGKLAKGALSNAAVGGAFPLLFGQSGQAAAGGAIGGILGSLIPGVGGFGGSLIGTLIGEKAGQGNRVKELAADIGFSAEQTKMLGTAFQQAGRDFDKFQESVSRIQGLSLSIEDQGKAIQLASALTENYGGKIDKVTNAFSTALETGKVTQGTLNQLTNQGIPIQDALAKKYDVSRSAILQMAKDGKISVQDLIDTLVKLGNEGTTSATKQQKAFTDAYTSIQTAIENLGTTISSVFSSNTEKVVNGFNTALLGTLKYIREVIEGLDALAQVAGPILKVIADKYVEIETNALKAIGAIPGLGNAIVQMATTALGPLQGVALLIEKIRGARTLKKEKQGPYVPERLQKAPLTSFTAPSQFVSDKDSKNKAAENAAKRLAEQTQKQLIASGALLTDEQNRLKILGATDELQKLDLEYEKIRGDRFQKFVKLYKESLSDKERSNIFAAQSAAIAADDLKYQQDKAKILADQTAELAKQLGIEDFLKPKTAYEKAFPTAFGGQQGFVPLNNLQGPSPIADAANQAKDELTALLDPAKQVQQVAESIGTSFSNSFKGLIEGTVTAQQALANFFQSVADAFLDMAAQIIAKWIQMTILNSVLSLFPTKLPGIGNTFSNFSVGGSAAAGTGGIPSLASSFSFVPGRAVGGPVAAGSPYMVGERGPELFVPGRSGTIVPNGAMGSGPTNVVVNVDASGSKVQGNSQDGKQLGTALAAAVQAEIIKQKRPGGLLA